MTIGVSDYADPDLRLGYAADDARGFAEVLQKQKGGLYGDVEVQDAGRRRGDPRATSSRRSNGWTKQVTSRDFGVVLIAGHGVTDEKQHYWFLPADASMKHLSRERGVAGRHPAHDGRAGGQGDPVSRHLPRQCGGRARPASRRAGRST